MAIYHLDVSHVSKAKGGSASAKNDYIEREGKYAKDAQELVASGHDFMPEFCKENPRDFWREADEHERKNAQVCSEIRIALPKELSANDRQDLVQAFIKERLKNQPCTWAIHRGDDNNPHAHIMYSARTNEPRDQHDHDVFFKRNGAKKNRDFIEKDWLIETRKVWAIRCNQHLAKAGSRERIDHRTLTSQCSQQISLIEAELEQPNPRPEIIKKRLEKAQNLDRPPQAKKYRKRPKRRFWHREPVEERVLSYKQSSKNSDISIKLQSLKQTVLIFLKNSELVKTLERSLEKKRSHDREMDLKREKDALAHEMRLEASRARERALRLSRPPKNDLERGHSIGD
jgi:hypothetical protein